MDADGLNYIVGHNIDRDSLRYSVGALPIPGIENAMERIGLVHYNSSDEIRRLAGAMKEIAALRATVTG